MNERIRLLALEAGSYVNEVYTGPVRSKTPGKIWEDGHVGWHEQFNEKFAQLIVRECLKEIKDMIVDESERLYPNNKQTTECVNDRLLDAYDNIKEHFGVEE